MNQRDCSPTECPEWLGGSGKARLRILFCPHWEPGLSEARAGLSPHLHTPPLLC